MVGDVTRARRSARSAPAAATCCACSRTPRLTAIDVSERLPRDRANEPRRLRRALRQGRGRQARPARPRASIASSAPRCSSTPSIPTAILAAMARLLRADGVAVITVPNDPLILQAEGPACGARRSGWALRDRVEWGGDALPPPPLDARRVRDAARRVTSASPTVAPPRSTALPIRACFRCVRAEVSRRRDGRASAASGTRRRAAWFQSLRSKALLLKSHWFTGAGSPCLTVRGDDAEIGARRDGAAPGGGPTCPGRRGT